MKRLIVLRHAKSSWSDPTLSDVQRPLSARGKRDAPHIGGRLYGYLGTPDSIITSPAVRALETARLVATELRIPHAAIRIEQALYLATSAELLRIVHEQRDERMSVLVVGHNPGITEFVNALVPQLELSNLATSGVVGIEIDGHRWTDLLTKPRRCIYYDFPKNSGDPQT